MNTLRAYKVNIAKQFTSASFVVGVIAAATLFFTSTGRYAQWGKEYTIFEMMLEHNKETILCDASYSPYSMVNSLASTYLCLFVPFICAFPAVSMLIIEKNSLAYRYNVVRCGKKQYMLGWYLSGIVTAGTMLLMAYILFVFVVFIKMPSVSEFRINGIIVPEKYVTEIIWRAAGWFVFGMVISSVYLLAASMINDIYICMCGVFSLMFIYDMAIQKIAAALEYSKPYLYNLMMSGMSGIRYIGKQNIAYAVIILGNAVIITSVAGRKRGDSGE